MKRFSEGSQPFIHRLNGLGNGETLLKYTILAENSRFKKSFRSFAPNMPYISTIYAYTLYTILTESIRSLAGGILLKNLLLVVYFRRNGRIVSKPKNPIFYPIFLKMQNDRDHDRLLSAIRPYVSNLKRSFTMSFFIPVYFLFYVFNLRFLFPIS